MDTSNQENTSPNTNGSPEPKIDLSTTGKFSFTNDTILATLAYLGPLVFIPFLTHKGNSFIIYHTKQGLVLFALSFVFWIISGFFAMSLFYPIMQLINIGLLVFIIIGVINALQSKEKQLPLIGTYADNIKL
jgi:uncharacterized membrane protein